MSERDCWGTPDRVWRQLNAEAGGFCLDAAALPGNAKCTRFWSPDADGCLQDWAAGTWCNPPWSSVTPWIDKAISEVRRGRWSVLWLPARTDRAWFRLLWQSAEYIDFTVGRPLHEAPDGIRESSPREGAIVAWITVPGLVRARAEARFRDPRSGRLLRPLGDLESDCLDGDAGVFRLVGGAHV